MSRWRDIGGFMFWLVALVVVFNLFHVERFMNAIPLPDWVNQLP